MTFAQEIVGVAELVTCSGLTFVLWVTLETQGWVNGFLATKCSRDPNRKKHEALIDEVGAADTERQDLKSISLSEMREAASKGKFIEVQWTATVAQALLHPELME